MQDGVRSAGSYLSDFLAQIVNGLPKFIGFLIILLIAYMVAKALSAGVHKLLESARLNKRVHAGAGGNIIQRALPDPSSLIAKIVYWVIFFFGLSIAVSVLGIPALVDFVRAVYGYLPNVLAAFLIFLVAGGISGAIATLATNAMGNTPTGKIVATVAPVLVMVIAVFMILNQLKIAPEIVNITYSAILFSAALGLALAFGLGGRDVASKMLQDLYIKGQEQKDRVKSDFKQGAQNAKQKANNLRDRA